MRSSEIKVVATNRKARYEYTIEDRYEAGIALTGSEIKSIRAGAVSLGEGYVQVRDGELWLVDVHVAAYEQAGMLVHHDSRRPRKLLLHRREIDRLVRDSRDPGYTIVPLRMYMKGPYAKVEIGLAKGKRQYDKRQVIAERDADRRIRREAKEYTNDRE